MARPGRPRKYDPIADEIRQAIKYSTRSEAIDLIKNSDIDVLDGESRTPLIHAASEGNIEISQWLVANGAELNHQDRTGWCALHYAVQGRHVKVINFLVENDATVDLKDHYGNTPLWQATFDARGDYELVRLLVAEGASPISKNKSNRSPLDFAEQIGDETLVAELKNGM
jgi:uncharacterized protein